MALPGGRKRSAGGAKACAVARHTHTPLALKETTAKAPEVVFQGRQPPPQLLSTPLQSVVPGLPRG
jgi:hypothetical protein